LGGAILSKYTGIFLGLGALMAVVGHQPWRRHLRSVHPYAASALAFAMFSPVIIWNSQHDWASFRFQFMNRFAGETANAGTVVEFVVWQIAVATPLLLPGVIWLCVRTLLNRRRLFTPRLWMALSFSLPLLMVMAYKSLKDDIHPNWTLPAFLSVFPAVAQLTLVLWRSRRKKKGWFSWQRAALTTAAVCLTLNVLALAFVLAVQPRTGLIPALRSWPELAMAVEKQEVRLKVETGRQPLVIGMDKYRLASVLAFYRTPLEDKMRASDSTTSQWIFGGEGLGFPYWTTADQWIGSDCIIVDEDEGIGLLASRFRTFEAASKIQLNGKTYYIAVGHGLHD
jgi:dolichol-phosphate mannosyltransferase